MVVIAVMSSEWIQNPNHVWEWVKQNPTLIKNAAYYLLQGEKLKIRIWSHNPSKESLSPGCIVCVKGNKSNYIELAKFLYKTKEETETVDEFLEKIL